MLIYQESNATDKLNLLFNTNKPAGLTVPGDIVLQKGATVTVGTITYTGVSASFASASSTLNIDGATITGWAADKVTISGQAALTGGSNATVTANITLPLTMVSSITAATGSNNGGKITTITNGTSATFQVPGWGDKIESLTAGSYIEITGSGASRTIAVTGLGTAAYKDTSYFLVAGDSADYIKTASVNGNTLTLTNQAGTVTTFTNTTYSPASIWADGLMAAGDKVKLNGIAVGAEVNVQSNWNQTDGTKDDYIKNKPNLATVATTGLYSDLSGTPTIPTVSDATITIQQSGQLDQTFTLNGGSITITLADTTYSAATTITEGLMSAADKTKLDACIELDNGNYYLKAGDIRTKIADIVTQIRCFREDTSYVTMYDGTTKLISEVKPGDSVLGYDVNKQDYCEALVVSNDRTGEVNAFDCYVFEDGTTVDIDGIDSFLTHYMSNFEGLESDFTDCFNVSPIDYLYKDSREKRKYFRKVVKSIGGKDNGVAVIYKRGYNCATPTGRYRIQTSNGTCFINGLCHARKPIDTVTNLTTGTTTFTSKIQEVFANIFARQAKGDNFLPDDHIEDTSATSLLKELTANNAAISLKKDYLNSTDYKAMKYAEGALSEEDWLPIKEQRIAARAEINRMEERNSEIVPLLRESNPNLMDSYDNKYWWVENNKCSMLDFADLNSLLEDFREYLRQ